MPWKSTLMKSINDEEIFTNIFLMARDDISNGFSSDIGGLLQSNITGGKVWLTLINSEMEKYTLM